jgi:hypothetical protein
MTCTDADRRPARIGAPHDLALRHAHRAGRLDEVPIDARDARLRVHEDRRDREDDHRDKRRVDLEPELRVDRGRHR